MAFHINSKGEPGECSAKAGRCPFGSADEHYPTAASAQAAFEQEQPTFGAPQTKNYDVLLHAVEETRLVQVGRQILDSELGGELDQDYIVPATDRGEVWLRATNSFIIAGKAFRDGDLLLFDGEGNFVE